MKVIFWLFNFARDFGLFFLSSMLLLIVVVALDDTHTYTTNGAQGTLVLIMIMFGFCAIPFSYIVSFLANSPASGFTILQIVNILAGCIAPIAAYVLKGNVSYIPYIIFLTASFAYKSYCIVDNLLFFFASFSHLFTLTDSNYHKVTFRTSWQSSWSRSK